MTESNPEALTRTDYYRPRWLPLRDQAFSIIVRVVAPWLVAEDCCVWFLVNRSFEIAVCISDLKETQLPNPCMPVGVAERRAVPRISVPGMPVPDAQACVVRTWQSTPRLENESNCQSMPIHCGTGRVLSTATPGVPMPQESVPARVEARRLVPGLRAISNLSMPGEQAMQDTHLRL